jgi:hypothetical protein
MNPGKKDAMGLFDGRPPVLRLRGGLGGAPGGSRTRTAEGGLAGSWLPCRWQPLAWDAALLEPVRPSRSNSGMGKCDAGRGTVRW